MKLATRSLFRILHAVLVAGAICAGSAPAWAQLNGSTGALTDNEIAFTNLQGAGVSLTFRNVGQSSHWLTYCTSSSSAIQIALEASEDNNTWFQISDLGTATGCNVLSAGGYFQYVRAHVYALSGGSVSAFYTASSFPIAANGLVSQGASTQKVSLIAASAYGTPSLSSTVTTVTGNPAIVYAVHAYNPNASTVFVSLTDNGTTLIERAIPANSASDLSIAAGVLFSTNVNALCSSNAVTPTAPASSCLINVLYRPLTVVNSSVHLNGTVYGTRTIGW